MNHEEAETIIRLFLFFHTLFDIVILIVRINFHTHPREVPFRGTIRLLSRHPRDTTIPFTDQRKLNKKSEQNNLGG